MQNRKTIINLAILIFLFLLSANSVAAPVWQRLDDGLYFGEFDPERKSKICNHKIIILKIDPRFYSLKLLSASEHDRKPRTAKQWCSQFGLLAAINASMYQNADLLKSTGYMKNYRHFNNSHINRGFGSFMVFNPVDPSLPDVQIIDRRLQMKWKNIIKKYNTVVQNYRMISSGKKRGWPQQEQLHSTAAIGMDRDNNILFILNRSPYSTHDFIHILLSLSINIESAMYLEGGPEASLYFKINDKEMNLMGDCETDFTDHNKHDLGCKIPNVIGIVRQR